MSEDLVHIATQTVAYLAPFVPWLVKVGEGAAEEAGSLLGTGAWNGAKRIWARLRPAIGADRDASAAMLELSASPDDEDLRAQFRVKLRRLLREDDELAADLVRLLADAPPSMSQTGMVIRGNVRGGQQAGIVYGDMYQDRSHRPRG
jgi:hypothetical protein